MAEAQDTTPDSGSDDADLELVGLVSADLPGLSLGDLRSRRDETIETETGLSYLRRLVQAPLDMVRGELERRADGQPRATWPPSSRTCPAGAGRARRQRRRSPAAHARAHRDRSRARRPSSTRSPTGGMRIADAAVARPTTSSSQLAARPRHPRAHGLGPAATPAPHDRPPQRRAGPALRQRRAHRRGHALAELDPDGGAIVMLSWPATSSRWRDRRPRARSVVTHEIAGRPLAAHVAAGPARQRATAAA